VAESVWQYRHHLKWRHEESVKAAMNGSAAKAKIAAALGISGNENESRNGVWRSEAAYIEKLSYQCQYQSVTIMKAIGEKIWHGGESESVWRNMT